MNAKLRLWRTLARAVLLMAAQACAGYSVLTHEQVVDLLWADSIQPILKRRFPETTDQKLRLAIYRTRRPFGWNPAC